MKVTVSFELDIAKLAGLQAFLGGEIATTEAPTGKKKGAKAETSPVDEEFNFEEETAEEPIFEDATEPTIDLKVLRAEIKKRVDAGKTDALGKLFKAYKAKNIMDVKADKYQSFYDNLMKIKVK
jgi:hypothetical protein